jgi:hypothetical protein
MRESRMRIFLTKGAQSLATLKEIPFAKAAGHWSTKD